MVLGPTNYTLLHHLCIQTYLQIWSIGYVVQGSNGEYAYLTPEERVEMVRKMRDMTPADKLIIAGSGCECKGFILQ